MAHSLGYALQTLHNPGRRHQEKLLPLVRLSPGAAGSAGRIEKAGWQVRLLDAPAGLADSSEAPVPSCLLLDVAGPSCTDFSFLERLAAWRPDVPVICMVSDKDAAMVVRVMKAGAFDVMLKPVAEESLIEGIRRALGHSETMLAQAAELFQLKDRYASLSQRERQVMTLIAAGLLNKQVAGELGISEITVKAHRGRLMRKMEARSFASLIKMATNLALQPCATEPRPSRGPISTGTNTLVSALRTSAAAIASPASGYASLPL